MSKCWQVIGYVDAYGAVHTHKLTTFGSNPNHADLWPTVAHKRFRFIVSEWELSNSPISGEKLNSEDVDAVMQKMRKILPIPEWVSRGDAWEAAGRPYGKAQDAFLDKWEAQLKKKKLARKKKA